MVEVGEVEIPIAPLLHHMAVYFEKGFDRRARRTIQSMELYAFFIVAVIIGTMVVAMYQPLFKMAGTV
jgi:type II secretory pathway component PulF